MLTGFAPIYDENARVLIVGTMPSAASLAAAEYYAHKRNAFWPMMAQILGEPTGQDYGARCAMLRKHKIALWDVLAHCEREGSLDAAIRSEQPNDFAALFAQTKIRHVFANGKTAERLFQKYVSLPPKITFHGALCSTSPAYTLSYEKKCAAWRAILPDLNEEN